MFGAGSDTVSVTTKWPPAFHPRVRSRCRPTDSICTQHRDDGGSTPPESSSPRPSAARQGRRTREMSAIYLPCPVSAVLTLCAPPSADIRGRSVSPRGDCVLSGGSAVAPANPGRSVLFHLLHIQGASRSLAPVGFAHRATKDIVWVRSLFPFLSLHSCLTVPDPAERLRDPRRRGDSRTAPVRTPRVPFTTNLGHLVLTSAALLGRSRVTQTFIQSPSGLIRSGGSTTTASCAQICVSSASGSGAGSVLGNTSPISASGTRTLSLYSIENKLG